METWATTSWIGRWLAVVIFASVSGCATHAYRLGSAADYRTSPELAEVTEAQIERGTPRPVLDTIGWVIGIPSKIILWDRRIDNHDISFETEEAIAEYIAANELDTVKVRLNEYAPGDEWRRLVANKSVGWGWRYTAGTFSWLGETIFPGRIWGGDHYNPFTNTVYVFSDVPAVAIHEGGHAKDFARRNWKGTYAAAYLLPVVPLWHEAIATNDALGYLHEHGSLEQEQDAYCILYPAYGTYVGNAVSNFVPWDSSLVFVSAVIPGHILGRIKAKRIAQPQLPEAHTRRLPDLETTDEPTFQQPFAGDVRFPNGSPTPYHGDPRTELGLVEQNAHDAPR